MEVSHSGIGFVLLKYIKFYMGIDERAERVETIFCSVELYLISECFYAMILQK